MYNAISSNLIMTNLSLSPDPSYYIYEMTIFTCIGFLFKERGHYKRRVGNEIVYSNKNKS